MSDHDLDHLADHIALFRAFLQARFDPDRDTLLQTTLILQERIAHRATSQALAATAAFERLGLCESEAHVIWLLAAIASSHEVRALMARATGETTPDPTLAGIRSIVHGVNPTLRGLFDLSARSRLRSLSLIERSDGMADIHESRQTWALSNRVVSLLHGEESLDPELTSVVGARRSKLDELVIGGNAVEQARRALEHPRGVIVVSGSPGLGKSALLVAVATNAGKNVLEIDTSRFAKEPAVVSRQLRSIARECKLLSSLPLLANLHSIHDSDRLATIGRELVAQLDGPVLATCGVDRPVLRWDRPTIVVEMDKPSTDQLGELWVKELGQGSDGDADILATRYPLAPALIHHAAAAAKARSNGRITPEDIAAGVRTVLDDRLSQYARRVTVTQTWDDLVLPADHVESIVELLARVRGKRRVFEDWGFGPKLGKGTGLTALFSGPPGTGKTMVASLIARELGLELYQVDLGKVVSKWIGETEKNLGALFDAAEAGHAVLLFDEADALFGKRTEVKSSNDRHANLETNYLLQRLESFTGICLLTSNHESHIDAAFQRRLSLHVRFELPEVDERARLWRAMIPSPTPVAADVDFGALARRYAMSGGYIRNAVLRAAFLAADQDEVTPISQALLERAARVEYEGMGKLVA